MQNAATRLRPPKADEIAEQDRGYRAVFEVFLGCDIVFRSNGSTGLRLCAVVRPHDTLTNSCISSHEPPLCSEQVNPGDGMKP